MVAIDYVSPLPPVRSGIADYSLDLIPRLAARCDLRLIQAQVDIDPASISSRPVVPLAEVGTGGRLPLYQMGNNEHHGLVYQAALETPGVLTLHDLVLHHFLLERTVARGDVESYREVMTADHGWMGEEAARFVAWGARGDSARFELPVRRHLLRRQRGVLVHGQWAADRLWDEDPELRVAVVPMGVPLPSPVSPATTLAWRRAHGLAETLPLLGSFGFQTPIKRTDVIVRALAQPALAGVHLVVGGEISPALDLAGEAAAAGVADRVHFIGFVPFDELQTAIAATDLGVNLRYPTAGETSASLLRVLAAGRPTVVSDYAQFAALPDDVVVKVPLAEDEEEVLADRVGALLAQPDALRALGSRARELVAREHDPDRAAAAVVAACTEWRDAEPPGLGRRTEAVPTSLTWSRREGSITVSGTEEPWPGGERRELAIRLENRGREIWLAGRRGVGSVALEVRLEGTGGVPIEKPAWVPLPVDVPPDESIVVKVKIRRPARSSRLRVEPHVVGGEGFGARGGPVWAKELG